MKKVAVGLLFLLIVAEIAHVAMAQTVVSGAITGTVTDPNRAAVPNAKVTLKGTVTGGTRTTDANLLGKYQFALLPPGTYVLTVQAQGFTREEHLMSVQVNRWTLNDVKLVPGDNPEVTVITSEDMQTAIEFWYPGIRMSTFPYWLAQK
jgi:hypothetical protein